MEKSRILMKEQPLVVNVELARVIGLNEAIVLQQIEYWLHINELSKKERSLQDGFYWTYNTVEEWTNNFPFWSYDTVKRTLKKLREKGVIIVGNYNQKGFDRTLWYRIDYARLDEVEKEFNTIRANCTNEENSQSDDTKTPDTAETDNSANCTNGLGQNAPMHQGNLPQAIPETTTETSSETTVVVDDVIKQFEDNICNLKKITKKNFLELIKNLDLEYVQAIINYCAENSARSFSYFEKTLKSYLSKDITTLAALELSIASYREEKTKTNKKKKINKTPQDNQPRKLRFTDYEQREYDMNKLEKGLLGWDDDNQDEGV